FEKRGAQFSPTFESGFLLRMWGPGADNELIQAALEAYTQPYGPDNAAVPKLERVYDAMMRIFETALRHRGCSSLSRQPLATLNITVPLKRFLGDETAEPAVTEDGVVLPDQMVSRLVPDSWLRRFVTDEEGQTLLDVGRKYRCAPDPVRQAAGLKKSYCQWHEGCDVPRSWSQYDHIVPFSHGGTTSSDNMQILCATHNRLKHRLQTKVNRQIWEHHHAQNRQETGKEAGSSGDGEGEPAPPAAL
ncbi:HNH endonuclease signature motif containing protein, partial [Streptomyces sp. IGB124]|uniref:HNH endonuclease signature motif containing protein n=1 Tax=Streptomyces sp. IGB124 TaxID=1519485 RepID=UPI000AE2CD3E